MTFKIESVFFYDGVSLFTISLFFFCSNAIKFTHEGKVGKNLYVVPEPSDVNERGSEKKSRDQSTLSANTNDNGHADNSPSYEEPELNNMSCDQNGDQMDQDKESRTKAEERVRCDVYDTGIGIPGTFSVCFLYMSVKCW